MARQIMTYESLVSDVERLRTLRIGGIFVDSGDDEAEVAKGTLCVRTGLADSKAYAGKKNPNSWIMKVAGATDTEIYAAAPHATDGGKNSNGIISYFGANTLEIVTPAGSMIGYERMVDGYMYNFGEGNFSTQPDLGEAAKKYATIADGKLVATATKPTTGVYFEVLRAVTFTEGTRSASGYCVMFRNTMAVSGD